MESTYKGTVSAISEQINEYINKRMHEIANTPVDHKYQIGDILYGSTTDRHYFIEEIKHNVLVGWCYHYRILETDELGYDTISNTDKAKNFSKIA